MNDAHYEQLTLKPTTLREANDYVRALHRHHKPATGHKFSIGIVDICGRLRGVVIAGRPVARMLDDGYTLEVNRCCTDGVSNGCSMLYRAAWRAAKAMGYLRVITYTLSQEGGASLRGAGFRLVGERGGGSWSRINRLRGDHAPLEAKLLWEVDESAIVVDTPDMCDLTL